MGPKFWGKNSQSTTKVTLVSYNKLVSTPGLVYNKYFYSPKNLLAVIGSLYSIFLTSVSIARFLFS